MEKIRIVAIGEMIVDCISEMGNIIEKNPGGAPANFLCAASNFLVPCGMIGKVGKDSEGSFLINELSKRGVSTKGVVIDEIMPTTKAMVDIDENGDRSFKFLRDPGADTFLTWEEVDKELIENCDLLHFGTLSFTDRDSQNAVVESLRYAKRLNKKISFDVNYRKHAWKNIEDARKWMRFGLEMADIVKMSDEEIELLLSDNIEDAAKNVFDEYNLEFFVITMGNKGAKYISKNGIGFVSSINVKDVVDTTGAGDIFFGTCVAGLLLCDKDIKEIDDNIIKDIIRTSNIAAGISTRKKGGISSIPGREQILKIKQQIS